MPNIYVEHNSNMIWANHYLYVKSGLTMLIIMQTRAKLGLIKYFTAQRYQYAMLGLRMTEIGITQLESCGVLGLTLG